MSGAATAGMDCSPYGSEFDVRRGSMKKTAMIETVARDLAMVHDEVGRLQEARKKERSNLSSLELARRQQDADFQKLLDEYAQLKAAYETSQSDYNNLKDEVTALRAQLSSSMDAVKACTDKCDALEQMLSEQTAKAVAADGGGSVCAATQEAILQAIRKEREQSAAQVSQQQTQQSSIMVMVEDSSSTTDLASSLAKEAGVQQAAFQSVNRVTSHKASSSYAAAATSNGSTEGPRGSSKSTQSGGSSSGSNSKGKPKPAQASHSNNTGSTSSGKGVWYRVTLTNPALAMQVLRKRGALKKAGIRVEEALSKEEHAIKVKYLEAKIPAMVWDNERVPVSWRRGRLVKLVKGEKRDMWEEVPLSYSVPEKK